MNLNYDNLNFDSISPEVRKWYSFPEDKTYIEKYLNHEMTTSKAAREANSRRARFESLLIISSLTVGVVSYSYLLAPSGKVIRDRLDAKMSSSKRILRRLVPFVGLALPFVLVRSSLQTDNNYRD